MSSDAASSGPTPSHDPEVVVQILEARVIDEMVAKIVVAASLPGAADAVAQWRAAHGQERWAGRGHDHAVVGTTLMYLHDTPDGAKVPHARYPDGQEKIYTDLAHAESAKLGEAS